MKSLSEALAEANETNRETERDVESLSVALSLSKAALENASSDVQRLSDFIGSERLISEERIFALELEAQTSSSLLQSERSATEGSLQLMRLNILSLENQLALEEQKLRDEVSRCNDEKRDLTLSYEAQLSEQQR